MIDDDLFASKNLVYGHRLDHSEIYNGQLVNNKPQGVGKLLGQNYEIEGMFKEGELFRFGKWKINTISGSETYWGTFEEGYIKHGVGVFSSEEKGEYKGTFKDDKMHGFGTLK